MAMTPKQRASRRANRCKRLKDKFKRARSGEDAARYLRFAKRCRWVDDLPGGAMMGLGGLGANYQEHKRQIQGAAAEAIFEASTVAGLSATKNCKDAGLAFARANQLLGEARAHEEAMGGKGRYRDLRKAISTVAEGNRAFHRHCIVKR